MIIAFISAFLLLFSQGVYAQEPSGDLTIASRIINNFVEASGEWSGKLEGAVKSLFYLFLALEIVVIAMKGLIQKVSLEDLIGHLIMAGAVSGIIIFFIFNYKDFTHAIMNGLAKYTELLGYDSSEIVLDPLKKGLEFLKAIIDKVSVFSPTDSLVLLLSGFAILIIFALITIQIIYIKCETLVAVSASFILMGFGAFSMTRDYMMSLLRYVISVGFKLYMLYAVLGMGFAFIEKQITVKEEMGLEDAAVMLVTVLIIYVLTKSLPDVAAGIINGAHVSTGNALASTIKSVAMIAAGAAVGGAMATAGGAKSSAQKAGNAKRALSLSKEEGGGVWNGVKNYYRASRDARNEANPTHNHRLRSKLEAMRESVKNKNQ